MLELPHLLFRKVLKVNLIDFGWASSQIQLAIVLHGGDAACLQLG